MRSNFTAFAFLALTAIAVAQVPTNGLVGEWKFSGNAYDTSGNNLHGTVRGVTLTTDRYGNPNSAYYFDGSHDIQIGDPVPTPLQIQSAITMSAWIYPTADPNQLGLIVGCQHDPVGTAIQFDTRTNADGLTNPTRHIHFQLGDGSGWHVTDVNAQLQFSQWAHVVVTRQSGQYATAYYNGVQVAVSSGAQWTSNTISYSGAAYNIGSQKDAGRYFIGKIDDVRVYNRVLSAAEVSALYNEAAPPIVPDLQSVVAEFLFSGNARDTSGNALDGNIRSATLSTDRFGNPQNAMTFASGKDIQINQGVLSGPLQLQNELTLSAWIYPTGDPGPLGLIIGCQHDPVGVAIQFDTRTNSDGMTNPTRHIHFQLGDASGWHTTNSQTQLSYNTWTYIVATRKVNEDGKIYYNGVQQPVQSLAWTSGSILYTGATYAIGSQDASRYFIGSIDDARIYGRALTVSEIQYLYTLPAPTPAPAIYLPVPSNGLVAYYPFTGGDTHDFSGNNLHGTARGSPTLTTDRFGNINSALLFSGSQDVLIGDPVPALLQLQGALGMSAWIYPTADPAPLGLIVGCQHDPVGTAMHFDTRTNSDSQYDENPHIHFQLGDSSGWHQTNSQTSTMSYNNWYHIVATRTNNQLGEVYINGVRQSVASLAWTSGTISYSGAAYIIGSQKDSGRYFKGKIDDVRIYNRLLTASDVQALYQEGTADYCCPEFLDTCQSIAATCSSLTQQSGVMSTTCSTFGQFCDIANTILTIATLCQQQYTSCMALRQGC